MLGFLRNSRRINVRCFSTFSRNDVGMSFVRSFTDQDHSETLSLCSPGLKKAFPSEAAIHNLFTQFKGMYGDVADIIPIEGDHPEVLFTCETSSATLTLAVQVNEEGLVDSFDIFDEKSAPTDFFPPYAHADAVKEIPLNFGKRDWRLPASLTLPAFASPETPCQSIVVCLHDFGPSDRDGTFGPNTPFRDIALGLASRGIATLRFDKRTFAYAERCSQSLSAMTPEFELVDDAVSAIVQAAELPVVKANRVFVLGLGQGAYLAPRVIKSLRLGELNAHNASELFKQDSPISMTSATANPWLQKPATTPQETPEAAAAKGDPLAGSGIESAVKGLILLSAPARRIEDAQLSQVEHVVALLSKEEPALSEQLQELLTSTQKQAQNVKRMAQGEQVDADAGLPLSLPGQYWQALERYSPVSTLSPLLPQVPTLIVQGGRDYHATTEEDLPLWQSAGQDAPKGSLETLLLPKLSRSLVAPSSEASLEGKAHPREVFTQKGFVAQEVVDRIAMWVNGKAEAADALWPAAPKKK